MAVEENPLVIYKFRLDLGDIVAGFFTECSGIGSETESTEHLSVSPTGNENISNLPARAKYTEITLKRGITKSQLDIWDWRKRAMENDIEGVKLNGSIVLMDQSGPAAQWDIFDAWPSKVSGPEFKTDGNDYGLEELVLKISRLERVAV